MLAGGYLAIDESDRKTDCFLNDNKRGVEVIPKKRIIGLSCGRVNGNSEPLLKEALMGAEEIGVQSEIVRAMELKVKHCTTIYSLLQGERKHLREYERIIEEGIRKGFLKPVNTRMLANMIKILIDAWVIKRWDLREKVRMEEMREGILDLVFNGIMKDKSRRIKHHTERKKDR